MNADEHERYYAERSKMTVDEIRKQGGYSVHCDCDSFGCPGRSMVFAQRPAEWLEAIRRHVERGQRLATEERFSRFSMRKWFETGAALADGSKNAKDLPPMDPA